jgi:hypothetical protein
VAKQTPAITEMGLLITTRLNLLRHVLHRLRYDSSVLAKAVDKVLADEHYYTATHEGVALPVDNEKKYWMIADLHSVLYEADAGIEGMKKFMRAVHEHVRQPIDKKQCATMIDAWMSALGFDSSWYDEISGARNFIAHDGAFYLAFDTTQKDSWDLLMVKGDVRQFNDPSTFVRVSRVTEIVNRFLDCGQSMQKHLVSLLDVAK